jgi:hypothetical protein
VLLAGGLRSNGAPPKGEQHIVAQGRWGELGAPQKLDGMAYRVGIGHLALGRHAKQVGEKRRELLHLDGVAGKRDGVAAYGNAGIKGPLHQVEHLVGLAHHKRHVYPRRRRERCLRQISHTRYCTSSCALATEAL